MIKKGKEERLDQVFLSVPKNSKKYGEDGVSKCSVCLGDLSQKSPKISSFGGKMGAAKFGWGVSNFSPNGGVSRPPFFYKENQKKRFQFDDGGQNLSMMPF